MKKYKLVIFDLDGTLLDTTDGILSSARYAIDCFHREMPSEEVLNTFIGPPIQESFGKTYGLPKEEADRMAAVFRDRYKGEDLLKAKPYPGIYDALASLRNAGMKLAVATYKREDYALRLLKHYGFDRYFDVMFGSDMEGKLRKSDIVLKCMSALGVENREDVILVGDTIHDAEGAAKVRMDFLPVAYGFGFRTPEELTCVDRVGVAATTKEIQERLIGMQKVLILNGSLSEIPFIKEIKTLGYYVITSGNSPDLVGHKYADEYIMADYSDYERILEIVKENGISGIVSCANDFGAITAAYVAEKMGWPGHDTFENTVLLHQKDRFKAYFYEHNIPSPHSIPFTDETEALKYAETAEYPIIVKAVDLTGGKGINRAYNLDEAKKAIAIAFGKSRVKHIVIEPFLEGAQESIDTFVIRKKVVSYVTNNAYSPVNPYLIQTEILPSDNDALVKDRLIGIIEGMCEDLDLKDGLFTLQYIVKNGKPYVIELMRRPLGNQFLTVATAQNGFPWHEAEVRAELGLPLDNLQMKKPLAANVGHHGIMVRKNGVVKSVQIDPDLEKHIFQRIDILQPGERINDYMNERVAYIYYAYDNREEIVKMATHANELIKVEMED